MEAEFFAHFPIQFRNESFDSACGNTLLITKRKRLAKVRRILREETLTISNADDWRESAKEMAESVHAMESLISLPAR